VAILPVVQNPWFGGVAAAEIDNFCHFEC